MYGKKVPFCFFLASRAGKLPAILGRWAVLKVNEEKPEAQYLNRLLDFSIYDIHVLRYFSC